MCDPGSICRRQDHDNLVSTRQSPLSTAHVCISACVKSNCAFSQSGTTSRYLNSPSPKLGMMQRSPVEMARRASLKVPCLASPHSRRKEGTARARRRLFVSSPQSRVPVQLHTALESTYNAEQTYNIRSYCSLPSRPQCLLCQQTKAK